MSQPSEGICKVGFRRWYERQLIECHAWLATCFLSMILVAAGIELLSLERGVLDFAFDATLIGSGIILGWIAWRRYAQIMVVASYIGEQANCPACGRYGFRCERGVAGALRRETDSREMLARCPKCKHAWTVSQDPDVPLASRPGAR